MCACMSTSKYTCIFRCLKTVQNQALNSVTGKIRNDFNFLKGQHTKAGQGSLQYYSLAQTEATAKENSWTKQI